MKSKLNQALIVVCMVIALNAHSQSVYVVEPGLGTLNTAVKTHKGTRIYQLKAGEWYGLNAPIENVDYHLQIIGAEPAVAGGMPATLQTGSNVNGSPFAMMFDAKGDLTLKNVYFVNADLTAQVGDKFIVQSKANTRIIIDRSVLHPACVSNGVDGQDRSIKTYFTNNQVINHGHQLSPNDNAFFMYSDVANTIGVDTLLVENNTFVCMGTNMFLGGFGTLVNNYVNFNHNTFVLTKSQLGWATKKNEEYWTNNLMFNVNTQPYSNSWQPMPGGDPAKPKPNLIWAAPLDNEVLPSNRPNFVQYNSHYRAKGFYDIITEMNAFAKTKGLPFVYLFPLVWPKDTVNSREAHMFNSIEYPRFKYGNTMTDVDPQWVDKRIYEHETKFIAWTRPASYIHAMAQPSSNYPAPTAWPQYWWIPSEDLSNNSVWPVFNGVYTNPETLNGSIEKNIPLGDLNWFPKAKAVWQANKERITAHIKAGNTEQIDIGYSPTAVDNIGEALLSVYPNPAVDELQVRGTETAQLSIMTLDGRVVKTASNVKRLSVSDLTNGYYLVKLSDGGIVNTTKLLIQK